MARAVAGASRTALAALAGTDGQGAILWEDGRQGQMVFDASDLSAEVSADTEQGIYIAPDSDPTGASGAWVRKFNGPAVITPEMFGAVGDGVTDDSAAFVAAVAVLKAVSESYEDSFYKGSSRLRLSAKIYYLGTTTLDINHTLIIEGEGTGQDGGIPTMLRWAAGATGIRVHAYNTVGATGSDAGSQKSAVGTTIRGLYLHGGYTNTEGEYHGIHMRGRAVIEDVYIYNFQGDGVHINATAGGGGVNEGNCNVFFLNKVAVTGNRNGIYVNGADANAGVGIAVNAQHNRQWGIWDSSFLGNTWIGPHLSDNGLYVGATPTVVSYGGNRYALRAGQSAGAATNAPSGTTEDNTWWIYNGAGGASPSNNIPAWANPTTVREGGSYLADDPSQVYGSFINVYTEGGQGIAQTEGSNALILGGGGTNGNRVRAVSGVITVDDFEAFNITNDGLTNLGDQLKVDNADANKAKIVLKCGTNHSTWYYSGFGSAVSLYDIGASAYQPYNFEASSITLRPDGATAAVALVSDGVKIANVKVIGAQGAAIANATDAASAITQLNLALAALRTHGLIAT